MDAKTLAAAAGLSSITFYSWVQREQIPGLSLGTQGRKREYSINDAVTVAVMAELTRQGLTVPIASKIAGGTVPVADGRKMFKRFLVHRGHRFYDIDVGELSERERGRRLDALEPFYGGFNDYADLAKIIENHEAADFAPAVFIVVDVERIRVAMMRVERDYQRRIQGEAVEPNQPAHAGQLDLALAS